MIIGTVSPVKDSKAKVQTLLDIGTIKNLVYITIAEKPDVIGDRVTTKDTEFAEV